MCSEETDLNSNSSFTCDNLRVGYFVNSSNIMVTTKGNSREVFGKKLNKDDSLAILVHEGSYDLKGLVQVSFFVSNQENSYDYQFSVKNVPLSKNGKLYAFFGCSTADVHVRISSCKPTKSILNDQKFVTYDYHRL